MSGTDRPGPPEPTRGQGYDQALREFREVLELPVVGQPRYAAELDELRRLIGRYVDEARGILAEIDEGRRR